MLLLHISDIHFKKGEAGTALDPNTSLRNELVRDVEDQCAKIGKVPSAILISGDLAYGGEKEEYAYALGWLEELCRRSGAAPKSIFVIPGNHDVVRSVATRPLVHAVHKDIKNTKPERTNLLITGFLKDAETQRLLYESIGPYNDFAEQFLCSLLPPERTVTVRDLVLNDKSILRLSGINSSFVSGNGDTPGSLYVDPAYLQLKRESGIEHLVMCHHPYHWLGNGIALQEHLEDTTRIHLFGHEHKNRVTPARDWLRIAASAAHPDKKEPGWEPGYNLLEVEVSGKDKDRRLIVKAHVRVWQSNPGEFRAKLDRKKDVFVSSLELDPWSPPADPIIDPKDGPKDDGDIATTPLAKIDEMDSLRDISIRFSKLTLNQKLTIAGKLNLFEEDDVKQPDFERFRRVLIRARDRDLMKDLDREVAALTIKG